MVRKNSDFFKALLEAPSPSGVEDKAVKIWKDKMTVLLSESTYYSDKMGNTAFRMGDGRTKLLLSGHIDEVNARVTNISDKGVISMMSTGGICKKSLVASHIAIMTDNGILIDGIVEKKAIHCEEGDDKDKVADITKFNVNVGAESKEEVEALGVHVGSPVIYARNTNMEFGLNQICSQGLDDKVGVFITYCVMEKLNATPIDSDWRRKYTVIGLAAVQEETGLRGASVAANAINPHISLDFDVTFANDGNTGLNKGKYGDIKLGEGGVIQYGPDKSMRINKVLTMIADEAEIPFQYGASRAGGTNTNAIQLRADNCETTLISIPNRSMHTPVEVVDWRDIQSIVDLVFNAIISCQL